MVAVKNMDIFFKFSFFLCFICVKVNEVFSVVFVWATLRALAVLLFLRVLQRFAAKAKIWLVLWCVNTSKDNF